MILSNTPHCKQEINATTTLKNNQRTEKGMYLYTAYRSYEHVCSYMFKQKVESRVVKSHPSTEKYLA